MGWNKKARGPALPSRAPVHNSGLNKAIAKKAGVENAELHRFRKTYADTLHEEGVSVNTIRIRLGHETLDVMLAYPKGKDAKSEEGQEHAIAVRINNAMD